MTTDMQSSSETRTADLALSGDGWKLRTKITVPSGPTSMSSLLPIVQSLANQVVETGVGMAEVRGQKVSCTKGCGACCRQLVPISEVEARRIRAVIEELPEPRRSIVRTRFAEARRRLEAAGLLDKLEDREQWAAGESRAVGLTYFQQGIPCPFLEEESCSIYLDRPVACREYLVTSPAENCARPTAETVQCVPLPFKVSTALSRVETGAAGPLRWVPLILAPEWADAHPGEPASRPGPEWVNLLVENLTKTESPQP